MSEEDLVIFGDEENPVNLYGTVDTGSLAQCRGAAFHANLRASEHLVDAHMGLQFSVKGTLNETILELMEYQDDDEVTRIIIETLAEIKSWQHRRNPHTPLRHIVLNRNLYNRVVQLTGL